MKTLPLSEVKAHLSELVDQVEKRDEEVCITRNGRISGIIISQDEYEGWQETLAIRSNTKAMKEIKKNLKAVKKTKKTYTLDELLPL